LTILMINTGIKVSLTSSLLSYYEAVKQGDLNTLAAIMTKESYLMTLESLGFKHAFKDNSFKTLLKQMHEDQDALHTVERLLSADLAQEARTHEVALLAFDPRGSERITVRYTEDGHPKKLYFSYGQNGWKIDYKAGRQKA